MSDNCSKADRAIDLIRLGTMEELKIFCNDPALFHTIKHTGSFNILINRLEAAFKTIQQKCDHIEFLQNGIRVQDTLIGGQRKKLENLKSALKAIME